jgi:hypothetical protein
MEPLRLSLGCCVAIGRVDCRGQNADAGPGSKEPMRASYT